ncbi:MAG: glycogen-binding domain-containing protein [Brevinematia bacterium]
MERIFLLLLILVPISCFGKPKNPLENTNVFSSPIIEDDHILFVVTNQARSVKILLESERWKPITMSYDERAKLWYCVYDKELKRGRYRYKLLIDNIVMIDPLNANVGTDELGGKFSFFELKNDLEVFKGNPKALGEGYYEFRYKDIKAEKVVLVGSFNHWNPYELEMRREYGGVWRIKVFLPKGTHYYYFIVDDQATSDPLNAKAVRDKHGNVLNVVEVN